MELVAILKYLQTGGRYRGAARRRHSIGNRCDIGRRLRLDRGKFRTRRRPRETRRGVQEVDVSL